MSNQEYKELVKNSIFNINNVLSFEELLSRGLTEDEKNLWLVGRNKIRKTKGLIIDLTTDGRADDFSSIYTVVDTRPLHYKVLNGMVRYDLKQLYLGCNDITEQEFVNKFMYDQSAWEKMCNNVVIRKYVDEWRKEQRLKVKSAMFGVILEDALDKESKTKTSSAKYLLEKYYDPSETKTSKQSAKDKAKDNEELILIQDDKKRLVNSLKRIN